MKKLMKALTWPLWWGWVRIVFLIALLRAIDTELEQESIRGTEVDTDLEVHYLRQAVRRRWGWSPPSPVEAFLEKVSLKRARELASRQ